MLADYGLQHDFGCCLEAVQLYQPAGIKLDVEHDDGGGESSDATCELHDVDTVDRGIDVHQYVLPDGALDSADDYDLGTACHRLGILVPLWVLTQQHQRTYVGHPGQVGHGG